MPSATTPASSVTSWASRREPSSAGPREWVHMVPMTSMNTAIGTIEDSAAAAPTTPSSQDGRVSVIRVNSARLESVSPGTTSTEANPNSTGTNNSSW